MTYPQEKIFDTGPCIWDIMITINRKDTYDIKLSKRRLHGAGRCAARAGPEAGGGEQSTGREDLSFGSGEQVERCGAHGAEDSQQADAGDDRGPRHQTDYAKRADQPAVRSHRRAQVPAADANQLRRRRITNRGLRAPIINHQSEGASSKRSRSQAGRVGPQARKPSVASSRTADPGSR